MMTPRERAQEAWSDICDQVDLGTEIGFVRVVEKHIKLAVEEADGKAPWLEEAPSVEEEPDTFDWDAYRAVKDVMDDKVDAACKAAGHRKIMVFYSAYREKKDGVPKDNLSKVAVKGRVRLVRGADDFFGGKRSRPYRSEVMENPTWLMVAVCANEMIKVVRDGHHVFLEGLDRLPKKEQVEPGVILYEFVMGS